MRDQLDNGGFDTQILTEDFYDVIYDLKDAARSAYELHYDGKNDDLCTKYSDTRTICK